MTVAATGPKLGLRALNRALLARQLLLARAELDPVVAVGQLVGLQSQAPQAPYVGLWTRLVDFDPAAVSAALTDRRLVRVSVMRGTIHLVTDEDCAYLRPLTQPLHERAFAGLWGKRLAAFDLAAIVEQARALVEARPLTFAELGAALAEEFPGADPASLAQTGRMHLALVQVPPRGLWRRGGAARHTTAESWLGRPQRTGAAPDDMVRRYLGAFGPASVLDLQAWSGLTRLGEVVARLRPELAVFTDDSGRQLFDLPDAPRPDPATPAPVRFLAEFDNTLLSHADRRRIIADEHRASAFTMNGLILGAVLVDGFVRAIWRVGRAKAAATLTVSVLGPVLSKKDAAAVLAEGRRLLDFAEPDATVRDVVLTAAG